MAGNFWMAALVCGCMLGSVGYSAAQEPPKRQAVLRFDEATREAAADRPVGEVAADTARRRPFACKLNRRRVDEATAYDAVTLWNVRRVRLKNRRMRLSDTTRREKVRLLKFFIERDRRKGARPHLLGNVAGYTWSSSVRENGRWQQVAPYIESYTLRREYDSVRRAGGEVSMFRVPEELLHRLDRRADYVLDGVKVPGGVFQFIDGLILRTLTVLNPADGGPAAELPRPRVEGDTYPDRVPLVIFGGKPSSVAEWLGMCTSGAFSTDAEVQMHYFYMLPLEAVQLYGRQGMYGAICVDLAE